MARTPGQRVVPFGLPCCGHRRGPGAVRSLCRGIHASGCPDGERGLIAAREPNVDAVVLDLMLPGIGGLAVCRALRTEGNQVPVLILTARGSVSERVAGLDAGADDYLVKPFALEELAARLRAIYRRRERPSDRLIVGDLVLGAAEQRAWRGDVELELSRREFDMLHALMDNAGRVVSRSYLLDEVWDGEIDIRSNAIDVHISKLRAIIDRPFGTVTITTLCGVGYRLVLNVAIAMAVVLAATSWFVFWRVEHALDRQLNRDLRAHHNVVVEAQRSGGGLPLHTAGEWYQVFDSQNRITEASKNLPYPYLLPRQKFDPVMAGHRVQYNHGSFVPPDRTAVRTMATEVDLSGGEYVLATAISRQPRDEALHELLIQLAIADVLALLGAAYVGYRTARGALDPVERYRVAATIAGATPGGRMPVAQDRDDELTRLGNTLNDLLARIEESVAREHRFIADASHELRTPLALLKAEVELALHQPRTPEYTRTVLLSVQAEVERMVELANALLDLEELASDQPAPLEPVDVPALLDTVADRYRPSLERQGRDIRVEAPQDLVAQLNQRRNLLGPGCGCGPGGSGR